MVSINELKESDKGRKVIFKESESRFREHGTITSWNDVWIFVDYHGDGRGIATSPSDLNFAAE